METAFDGFRLVQISDIHFGTWINRARLDQAVQLVNEQKPDVVAITGDFVTFDPPRFYQDLVEGLRGLAPADRVLAVMGNHDHWTDPMFVAKIIADSQIVDLNNAVHSIRRGQAALHFAGVDSYQERRDRLDLVLQRLPPEGSAVLLVHEPDFADISAATGRFDLQISGHSHGGQMILPWFGPAILPQFAARYPVGSYHLNGMVHYTNRGIGTARLPLRINCPPEITVLILQAPRG